MKSLVGVLLIVVVLAACSSDKKVPDVSHIKVNVSTARFEQDFFGMDTTNIDAAMNQLLATYGDFATNFVFNILGLPPQPDSSAAVEKGIKQFIAAYRPVYDSVQKKYPDIKNQQAQLTKGLQFLRYYFPNYPIPTKFISFVGPIDGYSNVLTKDAVVVGLQLYLGKDAMFYDDDYIRSIYPDYRSRRFEPDYIAVNSMNNLLEDVYPPDYRGKPLVEQMIEAGKRLYLLDLLLPYTADTLKTGYTAAQLKGCYEHEAAIWNFFLQNDLLFVNEQAITKDYMTDGPKTAALGDAAPGFIGQFVGWQIVKKWLDANEQITPEQLMSTPAKLIFEQAKYKPR
jgi:hypothetical protein